MRAENQFQSPPSRSIPLLFPLSPISLTFQVLRQLDTNPAKLLSWNSDTEQQIPSPLSPWPFCANDRHPFPPVFSPIFSPSPQTHSRLFSLFAKALRGLGVWGVLGERNMELYCDNEDCFSQTLGADTVELFCVSAATLGSAARLVLDGIRHNSVIMPLHK